MKSLPKSATISALGFPKKYRKGPNVVCKLHYKIYSETTCISGLFFSRLGWELIIPWSISSEAQIHLYLTLRTVQNLKSGALQNKCNGGVRESRGRGGTCAINNLNWVLSPSVHGSRRPHFFVFSTSRYKDTWTSGMFGLKLTLSSRTAIKIKTHYSLYYV